MSVFLTHSDFRAGFAITESVAAGGGVTIQFTAPDQIVLTGTTWAAKNIVEGMRIQPIGTINNDRYYYAETIVGGTMTVEEQTVVSEGPIVSTVIINGNLIDPDGIETWPIALLRSGGFNAISNFNIPYDGTAMLLTVNALAQDAVFGVDEYDWYVSQRTDVPANQYLDVQGNINLPPIVSFSGTLRMIHTTLAETEFGIVSGTNLTPTQTVSLFKDIAVYVRRISDGAIQWVDMLQIQLANTT